MLKYILNLGKLGAKASTKSFTFLFLLFLFYFVLSQIIITIIFYFFLICGTEMQGSWLVWGFCVMFFVPFSFLGGEVLCLSVLIFVIFFFSSFCFPLSDISHEIYFWLSPLHRSSEVKI